MGKFLPIERPVEAVTFQEVVDYGISKGAKIVDGLPTDFRFLEGVVVRSEDNSKSFDIYTWREPFDFNPSDMLIYDGTHLFSMGLKEFRAKYKQEEFDGKI